MAYKFKPNKSVAKRFRVTKTGKLKRHHSFTSHLMSSRPAKRRRKLRRATVLFEGHARNMRKMMGVAHMHPAKTAHETALRLKAAAGRDSGGMAQGTEPAAFDNVAVFDSDPAPAPGTMSQTDSADPAAMTDSTPMTDPAYSSPGGEGPSAPPPAL